MPCRSRDQDWMILKEGGPALQGSSATAAGATASGSGEPHCQIARISDQLRAFWTMLEILEPEKSTFSPGIKTHGSPDPRYNFMLRCMYFSMGRK